MPALVERVPEAPVVTVPREPPATVLAVPASPATSSTPIPADLLAGRVVTLTSERAPATVVRPLTAQPGGDPNSFLTYSFALMDGRQYEGPLVSAEAGEDPYFREEGLNGPEWPYHSYQVAKLSHGAVWVSYTGYPRREASACFERQSSEVIAAAEGFARQHWAPEFPGMLSALLGESGIVDVVRRAEASARADFELYVKNLYEDLMLDRAVRLSLNWPPSVGSGAASSSEPRPGVTSALAPLHPQQR